MKFEPGNKVGVQFSADHQPESNGRQMEKREYKVGSKVQFDAYDHDEEKDLFGRGWVKEINEKDNYVLVQTTRRLLWIEPSGIVNVF